MPNILRIHGWKSSKTHESGPEVVIEAEYIEPAKACVKCGVIGNLYRHGTKRMKFRDTPIYGKPCVIEATVQRYKCRACGETFMPEINGVEVDRRMTTRLVSYITQQCLRDTFTNVARHVGCVEGTIRNIAGDHIDALADTFEPYLPDWLGLDETKLDGAQRCVITDIIAHRPIDILIDRDKRTVTNWLWQFRKQTNLRGLSIDMWRPYLDAARAVFPGLPVVIDRFHVVRMANNGLDKVRIRVQKTKTKATRIDWKRSKVQLMKRPKNLTDKQRFNLQMWLDNEPEIAEAYRIKEAFFDLYDMQKADGIAAYDAFADTIPKDMKADFKELLTATKNWREEILAFFDHPISNGYTEALNGVAKVINRSGRGYSFEVLRARLLYGSKRGFTKPLPLETCWSCGGKFEETMPQADHIVPVGETTMPANALRICAACNQRFHTGGASEHQSPSTP